VKIAEHIRRGREVVDMYWNAAMFLWRVFTHPKNPDARIAASERAASGGRQIAATPYRMFTAAPVRVSASSEHAERAKDRLRR